MLWPDPKTVLGKPTVTSQKSGSLWPDAKSVIGKPSAHPGVEATIANIPTQQPSAFKNFISSIPGAFKTAGKTALELPKGLVSQYTHPSPTERRIEQQMPNKGIGKVASAIAKPITRTFEPIVESLGNQIGTAIGSKGKILPSPNDAFLAGGAFGLGAAGSFVGGEKAGGKLTEKVPYQEKTPFIKSNEPILFKNSTIAPKVTSTTKQPPIPLLEAPKEQYVSGENFVMKPKADAQKLQLSKALQTYQESVKSFNKNPTSYKLNQVQKARSTVELLKEGNTTPTEKTLQTKPISPQPSAQSTSSESVSIPPVKTSKLAQGVEARAIEQKLTRGFEGKPEYLQVNVKDQAVRATDLLKTNREQAIKVAMGHEKPPEGILPESVFVAVENHALKTKDVALLRDLATSSSLTSEATGMGQRIRMLAERDPNSAVATMKKVMKLREEAATKKYGPQAKTKITNEIVGEIKKAAPKVKDWSGFLEELKCH